MGYWDTWDTRDTPGYGGIPMGYRWDTDGMPMGYRDTRDTRDTLGYWGKPMGYRRKGLERNHTYTYLIHTWILLIFPIKTAQSIKRIKIPGQRL